MLSRTGLFTIRDCQAGFCTNNNPSTRMEDLTAWQNGRPALLYNYWMVTGRTDIRPDWQLSGLFPEKCVHIKVAGRDLWPAVLREKPEAAAEIDRQQILQQEKLFVSTDLSVPITRDENDLIDMHGLFALRKEAWNAAGGDCPPTGVPGAKLDAEHLEERLRRKQQLSTL